MIKDAKNHIKEVISFEDTWFAEDDAARLSGSGGMYGISGRMRP